MPTKSKNTNVLVATSFITPPKDGIITPAWLSKLPARTVFATGTHRFGPDDPDNLKNCNEVRWVAIKLGTGFWCIRVAEVHWSEDDVTMIGYKMVKPESIKLLVNCSPEAFNLYSM